jgi:peptidoglycan/LPS O-acetylase OafA/YrhL
MLLKGLDDQVNDSKATLILETEPSIEIAGRSHRVRNDIEGLRALAVLSVLINHAFPKTLPGGFAGVDIFFVISGYLIGKHLLQDIQAGRFSIFRFYAKRARRIFPALALVLISVWSVGWLVFSAPEFAALGKHIAAAAAFSNNILLWTESGYFDTTALDKPLLHLWSLGIEEQFYLVVPAILWLGTRGAAGSIRWVARLGALSLLATIFLSDFDYVASFYLLHTRFWELAAGVVLAQAELRVHAHTWRQMEHKSASKRDVREILAFSFAIVFSAVLALVADNDWRWQWNTALRNGGLAFAIVGAAAAVFLADRYTDRDAWNRACSVWTRNDRRLTTASSIAGITLTCVSLVVISSANWPGPQTLFPVLGATLFIAATPTALFNRLVAWRPLAFIGGISYPLYLWHWPAIVIFRMLNPEARGIELAIPLAASFGLAWLTKKFLEEPVRFGRLGLALFRLPPLWPLVSGLAFAGLLGLSVLVTGGLPSRFPPRLRAIAEWSQVNPYISWRAGHCYFDPHNKQDFSNECTPFKRPGVPLILLWGDSHAAHLYSGMADIQSTMTMDIAQWTAAACPPTVEPLLQESPTCATRRATAMNKLTQLNPDTIVLGGAWERYLEGGQSQQEISGALSETIRRLKELGVERIVVFGPGPLWSTSLPIDLFRFMARSHSNEIPERLGRVSDEIRRLDAALAALAAAENVQYVSVLNFFCDKDGCLTLGDKKLKLPDLLYWDREHLTVAGSKLLVTHSIPQWLGQN